jgi:hypothetical protein
MAYELMAKRSYGRALYVSSNEAAAVRAARFKGQAFVCCVTLMLNEDHESLRVLDLFLPKDWEVWRHAVRDSTVARLLTPDICRAHGIGAVRLQPPVDLMPVYCPELLTLDLG